MERIYLDANVFIAFVKSEMGKPFRLMFREAEEFFEQCPKKRIIVLSDHTLDEIEKIVHYSEGEIKSFFRDKGIMTEKIETSEKDFKLTLEFCRKGMHKADALHAALAINAGCDAILTFNKKDFETVKKIVSPKEPAELLE